MNQLIKITVILPSPGRNWPNLTVDPGAFTCKSLDASLAWGSSPSEFTLSYAIPDGSTATPMPAGAHVKIESCGHVFWGVVLSDLPTLSPGGNERQIRIADNRYWLESDKIFCAFNIPDDSLVDVGSGVLKRVRRWKHNLPEDFATGAWTYTSDPYMAINIIDAIRSAPTVMDVWTVTDDYSVLQEPLPKTFDWRGGSSLQGAISSVCESIGVSMTINGRYGLRFERKTGYEGPFPTDAVTVDVQDGTSLSGYPTRIRVLGDRNLYQIHDIPLTPDWPSGWNSYITKDTIVDVVYDAGGYNPVTPSPTDPENLIGWQEAKAYANEITVREFAVLVGNEALYDYKKYCGRARLDMPVMLYMDQIVWRAFRLPDGFSITAANGSTIPLSSLSVADKLLAKVYISDATAGANEWVTEWDTTENPDGSGFGVAKGFSAMQELFQDMRPERFNITKWNDLRAVWGRQGFQVDQGGNGEPYIIFDTQIVDSSNLITMVNGYAFFNQESLAGGGASLAFTVPDVRATITFEAEPFVWDQGDGVRTEVVSVPGLHIESVGYYGQGCFEIPYYDDETAAYKASTLAGALLGRSWNVSQGQLTRVLQPLESGFYATGTQLTGIVDRVTVSVSDRGCLETVYLTREHQAAAFMPESWLDRGEREKALLPGQDALRHEANMARMTAQALAQSPESRKTLSEAFGLNYGGTQPALPMPVENAGATAVSLPAGTPLWKKPGETVGGIFRNTHAVMPSASGAEHKVFAGAVSADGQKVGVGFRKIAAQPPGGDILVRVMGPVDVGDTVGGPSAGHDYLVKDGDNAVGVCQQDIVDTVAEVIRVRVGSAATPGNAEVKRYVIQTVSEDYFSAYPSKSDGTADTAATLVYIAKPKPLRTSTYNGQTIGLFYYATGADSNSRTGAKAATGGGFISGDNFSEAVDPPYASGDNDIWATESNVPTGVERSSTPLTLIDLNVSARHWEATAAGLDICMLVNNVPTQKRIVVRGGPVF